MLTAARDQRKVCDYCGQTAQRPLGPGQRCDDCAVPLEIDGALEYVGATKKDLTTAKARRSLAADVSDVVNIDYPDALLLINEIAGVAKSTT